MRPLDRDELRNLKSRISSPHFAYLPRCRASRAKANLRALSVRRRRVLQIHLLQRVHHDVGDGEMGEPLVIGGNDVPGRVRGAGVVDHVLVGGHVVVPAQPLVQVGLGKFPVLSRVIQSLQKSLLLLLFGDMQKKLQN